MIELLNGRVDIDKHMVIKEYYTPIGNVRMLLYDDAIQSITWTDEMKRNDICDYYYRYFFDLPVNLYPNGKECLLLGGGAFTYPKYYISKYLDKRMTVVEINEKMIEIAKKHFYLDELIKQYDANGERLKIIGDDANNYIRNCKEKYDYIIIDLFDGNIPIDEIYETKNLLKLKAMLTDKGIIVINYVISNKNIYTYKKILNEVITITKKHKIIAHKNYFNEIEQTGNIFIILSEQEITIPNDCDYIDKNSIIK